MKFSKGMLVVAGFSLAGVAAAQDAAVTTEKKAAIQNIVPGAYSSLEVRHSTQRQMTDDTVDNDLVNLTVRPTLGATFFDGKVDTAFTWIFSKRPDAARITKSVMYNETVIKALEGKQGYLGPYAYAEQGVDGQDFSSADLGLYGEIATDVEIIGGVLAFNGYWNPTANYLSARELSKDGNKAPVSSRSESLSLTEDQSSIEQRDPTLKNVVGVGAKVKPAAVKGLSIGFAVDAIQQWKPKYAAEEVGGDVRTDIDGYETSSLMINKYAVSYKLTDKVTLTNQLRQNVAGYYEAGIDTGTPDRTGTVADRRWENRVVLSATLF